MNHYLAVDLGAESGRVMLGKLDNGRISLEELHRFPNTPVRLPTGLYWDTFRLFHEIKQGLTVAGRERRLAIDGIGVDTWGVDFGLLGADGALVDNPRHYRDSRNDGMFARAFAIVPREEIYDSTGLQFMELNSLFQWLSMRLAGSPALPVAKRLLFMPDLLNYFLTGVAKSELTIASTSQFYDPRKKQWAAEMLTRLGLDPSILGEIVPPGTNLGPLLPHVAQDTGLAGTPVFATCSHDTASAVAAVPAAGDGEWCYISSGTWSLMGLELEEPIVSEQALASNLTNEIGAAGRVRFLRNIAGLWPVQECRRAWLAEGNNYSYEDLVKMAGDARPFVAVVQPDAFFVPGDGPRQVMEYCQKTGQETPRQPGEIVRVLLEGLALRYRQVLESLEAILGRRIATIHIVGGGSRNALLNQFAADASGRTVVAGPSEATALGNVLVQAIGAGVLSGLPEARAIVRASFPLTHVKPQAQAGWDGAYERFLKLPVRL